MASLDQFVIYFNDEFGRTLPSSKMFFYEAGTNVPKATYTDVDLASPNSQPMIADGTGVFSPVFLESGGYRIIVQDENGEQIHDRDNINVAETTLLSSSDLVFSTLIDAKQGILIDGSSVSVTEGQAVTTLGDNTVDDGGGAEWLVVAGGTGTPDDDLYADLSNGKQIKRLFNQLYTKNNLSEIADAGAAAQQEAQDNIGLRDVVSGFTAAPEFYLSDTVPKFTIGNLTKGAFDTVGPTGSGADYEWADMDNIPLDANYITINTYIQTDSAGGNTEVGVWLQTAFNTSYVAYQRVRSSNSDLTRVSAVGTRQIPLDGDNLFELKYDGVGASETYTGSVYLIGYGI